MSLVCECSMVVLNSKCANRAQVILEDIQLHREFLLGMIFAAFPLSDMQWGCFLANRLCAYFFSTFLVCNHQKLGGGGGGGGGGSPLCLSALPFCAIGWL